MNCWRSGRLNTELKKPFSADNYECRGKIYASIARGMSAKQWDNLLNSSIQSFKALKSKKSGADFTDMDGDTEDELDADDVSPLNFAALEEDSEMEE